MGGRCKSTLYLERLNRLLCHVPKKEKKDQDVHFGPSPFLPMATEVENLKSSIINFDILNHFLLFFFKNKFHFMRHVFREKASPPIYSKSFVLTQLLGLLYFYGRQDKLCSGWLQKIFHKLKKRLSRMCSFAGPTICCCAD